MSTTSTAIAHGIRRLLRGVFKLLTVAAAT
jgi:hypothetical protein